MVFEKIKKILAAQLDIDEENITADTNIAEDLGADSLDVVELMMTVEEQFGLSIESEEIANLRTVGDIVSFIEENA